MANSLVWLAFVAASALESLGAAASKDVLWQLPPCNIEIMEEDAWRSRFWAEFHGRSPALLRGWRSEAAEALTRRTERRRLLADFGQSQVRVGRGFFFHVQGQAQDSLSLAEFVESMPTDNYMFDFGEFMESSGLSANWTLPPSMDQLGTYDNSSVPLRFALGGAGQGMPFHSHEDSYHLQLQGRKRWGIYAPGQMTPTGVLHSEDYATWLRFRRTGKNFIPPQWECVSEPGDLLYVPEGFQHATACLGYSLAVVQHARRALDSSAVFHLRASVQALRDGQRKAAVKLAKKATRLDPTNADLWLHLARLQHGPRSAAAVAKYCEKALKVNPLCAKTRLHLLMAYNSLGLASKSQQLTAETQALGQKLVETVDFLVKDEQSRQRAEL